LSGQVNRVSLGLTAKSYVISGALLLEAALTGDGIIDLAELFIV